MESATEGARVPDPAILRYDGGLPVYRYGMAPDQLATARQLRRQRLSLAGLKPVGWLYYNRMHHLTCALYDRAAARPVRPLTERQRQALAAGRSLANTVECKRCAQVRVSVWGSRLCEACEPVVQAEQFAEWERRQREADEALAERIAADQAAASAWAAGFLADPLGVTLDAETVGLDTCWMVEIAVVAVDGEVLLDTLVNPQEPIPPDATSIHGITDEMVRGAPAFAAILPELKRVLAGKRVAIWNKDYDRRVLRDELDRHFRATEPEASPAAYLTHPTADAWLDGLRTECAMTWYAQWYGEWNDYWRDYKWQRLNGGHRARGDCEATIERLKTMAAPAVNDSAEAGTEERSAAGVITDCVAS